LVVFEYSNLVQKKINIEKGKLFPVRAFDGQIGKRVVFSRAGKARYSCAAL